MSQFPKRGEVWRVDLEPVKDHEQGRVRPALIVSNDVINQGPSDLITIVPITSKAKPIRSFLQINPPEGGLTQTSFIICDQVRTIARRRVGKRFGTLSVPVMKEVDRRLKYLLDLR